jgi:hypothetical protein
MMYYEPDILRDRGILPEKGLGTLIYSYRYQSTDAYRLKETLNSASSTVFPFRVSLTLYSIGPPSPTVKRVWRYAWA